MSRYEFLAVGHHPVRECICVVLPSRLKLWLWLIRNLHKFDYVSVTVDLKGDLRGNKKID